MQQRWIFNRTCHCSASPAVAFDIYPRRDGDRLVAQRHQDRAGDDNTADDDRYRQRRSHAASAPSMGFSSNIVFHRELDNLGFLKGLGACSSPGAPGKADRSPILPASRKSREAPVNSEIRQSAAMSGSVSPRSHRRYVSACRMPSLRAMASAVSKPAERRTALSRSAKAFLIFVELFSALVAMPGRCGIS